MRFSSIAALTLSALLLTGTGTGIPAFSAEEGKTKTAESESAASYTFSVQTNRPDAIYKRGEKILFTVQLLKDGKPVPGIRVQYRLSQNGDWGKTTIADSGKPIVAETKLDKPGWISIEAYMLGKDGKRVRNPKKPREFLRGEIGAMVDPLEIRESAPEPADFDAFWQRQREALNRVPIQAERKEIPVPERFKGKVIGYDVKVQCAGPKPVSGYLCMPADARKGSLPAEVTFHGAGVRSANARFGNGLRAISFDVNAHGIENGKPKEFYLALNKGELKNYRHQNKDNRDEFYFKGMYLRVMRALDYVKSLPEWDGKTLIVRGSSQGGGQSIVAAALDPQVTLCAAGVPALGDHAGRLAGRRPGWPQLVNRKNPSGPDRMVIETGKYFDNVYFAKRIRCETWFSTGFVDFVCPPTSVYAAYNNLPKTIRKQIQTTPTAGHNAPGNLMNKRCGEILRNAAPKK